MRIFSVDDLPQNWKIQDASLNADYLENKTCEIDLIHI